MAEGLTTAAGDPVEGVAPVDGEREFAAMQAELARSADADAGKTAPAPPKKAEAEDVEAPYGWTVDKDGTRRPKKAAGRPRKTDKAAKPRVTAPKPPRAKRDYTQDLTGLVQTLWGVAVVASPADAGALQVHGPGLVKAWNDLAQENARVASAIEWLTTGTAYGAVVMATAPLIMQVLANHGVLPAERVAVLGVQPPEVMAQLATEAAQGMAEQQQGV